MALYPASFFPYTMTYSQLASLPDAAEHFDWTPDQADDEFEPDLAHRIASYSGYLPYDPTDTYTRLPAYLHAVGLEVTPLGVTVHNESAVYIADAIFNQVQVEYDFSFHDHRHRASLEADLAQIEAGTYTPKPHEPWPTWELFGLGGDDSVDYFGTQPSCLTALLLAYNEAHTIEPHSSHT